MDVAGGLSVVQTILQLLGSPIWTETQSLLSVKSDLGDLKGTMSTIEAMLLDAERKERLHHYRFTHVELDKLRRLKEALYQADDLFDQVVTRALLKQFIPSNRFIKEVSLFFTCSNQFRSAFNYSQEIKNIRKKLGDIYADHQLHLGFGPQIVQEVNYLMRVNSRETQAFVDEEKDVIIGRNDDKRILIDMLLDSSVVDDVSVVSIVGIGGLGKTTLSQIVYNDDKIQRKFPLKMWVCVSDHFNVKALLAQILAAATGRADQGCLSLDLLQEELRKKLDGKKYLLVLDDVWNEDSEKWGELKTLLIGGGKDSRIVVTTRSKKVANVVGSRWTHELEGLSNADAWNLFQRMVLGPGQHQIEAHLVNIGQAIVGKCANVPLAIRVVGSLLRDQSEGYWEYIKNIDLISIEQDESGGILPVLKISYYHLTFHLKSCFSYCAVFPKDYRIIKEDLIALWMAQGFIIPSDGKSFEAVGEEYFMILLQRCFFQDVERDEWGEIVSCKMHDLIHDVAKEVAGKEVYDASCLNEQPRHVYVESTLYDYTFDYTLPLPKMTRVRTIILHLKGISIEKGEFKKLQKGRYLRVLDLNGAVFRELPSMIGEMMHLRYIDLSNNSDLLVLPMSIGQLYNLQTLKLRGCTKLEELPRELSKLVNLRHLDTYGCDSLTHMPQGMNCMTNLHKLPLFVLGRANGSSSAAGLGDLKNLNNLRGDMEIKVKTGWKYDAAAEVGKGEYLIKKRHLMNINICWDYPYVDYNAEVLLPGLEPPTEIRKLGLLYYPGLSFPSWSMNFPKLVNIELYKCKRLKHLPLMSQLPLLKVLVFRYLAKVEYVGSSVQVGANGEVTFFPSLEMLTLEDMPKLKGWWKTSSSSESNLYSFTQLSYLRISRCPNLTTFPLYPNVEELKLCEFNGALGPSMRADGWSTSSDGEGQGQGRLKNVGIDNVGFLNCLPIQSFHHLSYLRIEDDSKIERLGIGEVGEVFRSGRLSSVRSLQIYDCSKLKSISGRGVWEHFTALDALQLQHIPELELEEEDEDVNISSGCTREIKDNEMQPWRYLAPTLRSLELVNLPKLVKLPKGMHHLTALQSLKINKCDKLKALPPWIGYLSSLQSLEIHNCDYLEALPPAIGGLSSLQSLEIHNCDYLEALPPAIGGLSSLQSLKIINCDFLEALPPAIGGLSSLQSLKISDCKRLKSLPEEMRHLTSLNELILRACSKELKKRCKEPNGDDCSKIIHIPNIKVYD